MIDFHTSEYVPAVPGYRIVPEAHVIHVGLSAYLEPWHRELIMRLVTKIVTGEITSGEAIEATIIPFPKVING